MGTPLRSALAPPPPRPAGREPPLPGARGGGNAPGEVVTPEAGPWVTPPRPAPPGPGPRAWGWLPGWPRRSRLHWAALHAQPGTGSGEGCSCAPTPFWTMEIWPLPRGQLGLAHLGPSFRPPVPGLLEKALQERPLQPLQRPFLAGSSPGKSPFPQHTRTYSTERVYWVMFVEGGSTNEDLTSHQPGWESPHGPYPQEGAIFYLPKLSP